MRRSDRLCQGRYRALPCPKVGQERAQPTVEPLADGREPPHIVEIELPEVGTGERMHGNRASPGEDSDVARADHRHGRRAIHRPRRGWSPRPRCAPHPPKLRGPRPTPPRSPVSAAPSRRALGPDSRVHRSCTKSRRTQRAPALRGCREVPSSPSRRTLPGR